MRKACEKEAFLWRVYTEEERLQSKGKSSYYAGNWAVKAAVGKAFGTGIQVLNFTDIEVLRDKKEKTICKIYITMLIN
jgi:holo-[acyl-carrier protein] synthase